MAQKIKNYLRGDAVLSVSLVLALLSCLIEPPGLQYLRYIDFNTLIMLFCLMLIIEGLREQNFLQFIGSRILIKVKTRRGIVFTLVFLCFISSMFITNDVSLITFVPFGIMILEMINLTDKMCGTITLMTIAANLGSMFTPIGNPQNLYLFSLSGMGVPDFLELMWLYTGLAAFMLTVIVVVFYPEEHLQLDMRTEQLNDKRAVALYLVLFTLCVLTVAHFVPHLVLLAVVTAALLYKNKKLFAQIDYSLLLTFLFFFIFVGNMNHIGSLHDFIGSILTGNEVLISVLVSQVISNVPAAMLLSGYSDNYAALIIGTNMGGLGTLIASMASLISYKQVAAKYPHLRRQYLTIFTVDNLIFLAALYALYLFYYGGTV